MSIEFIMGGLGDGKSLYCMSKLRQYLAAGKKVATNYNINLEALCDPGDKLSRVIRVPDSPSKVDFRAIGLGSDVPGDKNHGLLLLDELGTWFNARDFANKERQKILKYCIHLRKKRWDVMFIVQDFSMVDKQLRGQMTTYLTTCRSSKKMSYLFRPFPKFHIIVKRNKDGLKAAPNEFLLPLESRQLYPSYDTEQLFNCEEDAVDDDEADGSLADDELRAKEQEYIEKNGLYCFLPPAYTIPKTLEQTKPKAAPFNYKPLCVSACLLVGGYMYLNRSADAAPAGDMLPVVVENAEAQQLEQSSGSLFTGLSAIPEAGGQQNDSQPASADPFLERFDKYRIVSSTRFGGEIKYTFDDGIGGRVTDGQLLDEGFRVISRGSREVTIMERGKRYIVIREFRRTEPLGSETTSRELTDETSLL